jgi:hypothetical protein
MRAIVLAALLAPLVLPRQAPDPFLLERLLPPNPLLYISVPQSPAVSQDYQKSDLHRFWNHPEVRQFAEPVEAWWKKRKTEPIPVRGQVQPSLNELARQAVGLSIDELWELLQGPLAFAVYDVPVNEQHKLDLVLSLGAGDAAVLTKSAASFKAAMKKQDPGFTESESAFQGTTIHEMGTDEFRVAYAVVERTIVLATRRERIEQVVAAAADRAFSGLKDDPRFKAARARVAPGDRHFLLAYFNAAGLLQQFRRELGDEAIRVLEQLGLADLTSIAAGLGYDGGAVRERYALLTSRQDRGILRFLAGGTPVDPAAALVPAGALGYAHFGVDFAQVYDVLIACSKVSPEFERELVQGIRGYEEKAGVQLREALATLGSSWTVASVLPDAGGLLPDDLYLAKLPDPAKFETALEKVLKHAAFPARDFSFRGQRIRHFTIGFPEEEAGLPFPIRMGYTISWFVKDGLLFASTSPLSLKRQILRMAGKTTPIAEDPKYAAMAARVPAKDLESWSYLDIGRWLAAFYNTLQPALHFVRDFARDYWWAGDLVLDAARLPLGETLDGLVGPTITNKRTLPDAILVDSISSVPVTSTTVVGTAGVVAAIAIPSLIMARQGGALGGVAANERVAELSLLFIRQAQETLKTSDSDRNGQADYWTRDVAGLYGLKDRSGQALFLLDPATAQADPEGAARYGLAPQPRNGYWFRVLTSDPDGVTYQKDEDKDGMAYTNPKRFGVAAYPAAYGQTGRLTFIVSEDGKVWKKDTQGQPPVKWPGKDPSQDGWQAVE